MKKIVVFSILLTIYTSCLHAQTSDRPGWLFGGYTREPGAETINNPDLHHYGLEDRDKRGWNAAVARVVHSSWLWVVADVSHHYGELHDAVGGIPEDPPPFRTVQVGKTGKTDFLVGPQIVWTSRSRLQPFGRLMIGASRQTAEYSYFDRIDRPYTTAVVNLAYSAGGGCDVRLSESVSIRVAQLDWITVRGYKPRGVVPGPYPAQMPESRDDDNSFRFSTGLVFAF